MDYTPGVSLAFSSQSRINYFDSGVYFPSRNGAGNLITSIPGGGPPTPGIFGYDVTHPIAGLLGWSKVLNMWQTFGTADTGTGGTVADGGPALPFIGGTSYVAAPVGTSAQALLAMDGYLDSVTGILVDQTQLNELATGDTPFPSVFAGNVATFDGVTLTLPLAFSLVFVDGTTTYTITTGGSLVAVVVPEPSTMVLFGFSVVGLLSYAWRVRKRKA